MPSQNLLQNLSRFLQNSQSAVMTDCQGLFNVGSVDAGSTEPDTFSWPEQIEKVFQETAAQLAATANGEGWTIEGVSAEEERANLWAIQSLLLEASSARNLFQRALNRFQSSQNGQGKFTPADMTEVRQEAMNVFDRLLTAALAKWIVGIREAKPKTSAACSNGGTAKESQPMSEAESGGGLGSAVLPVSAQVRPPPELTAATLTEFRDGVHAVSALIGKLRALVPSGRDEPAVQAVRRLQRMTTLLESLGVATPQRTPPPPSEPIRMAPLAVRAFMDALADAFRPLAEQKGLRLAMTCDSSLTSVETDAPKLHRAASLLIGNAVHYTTQGGISLLAKGQGPDWTLTIEDTGPGIEPAKLGQLLTGLALGPDRLPHGVAVTRELVTLLGGSLDADSVLRRGSRFIIRLPRGRALVSASGSAPMRRAG